MSRSSAQTLEYVMQSFAKNWTSRADCSRVLSQTTARGAASREIVA